ncbi:MAG TPA: tRNA (N6-isopentenyl adenosine(37)-C2)-methylthiotransferase MiaB, partial [Actinobacteria bacterium]|nr:tRNA (N6-isopentenyl adenosine(37)-C2)-methylthiotransferase MiaB [Actinomycetes bacterium]HEX21036.1 tRNA (N6-isopentenyl adenosine(37)-C2)-methylthiotransferase MiaB [Actinomycetota bacterium]
MTEKFIIKTFGCQMNKHDSGRLAGLLSENGYKETADINQAKVIIYNTCCVREHADDRLYGNVAALKELKTEHPEVILAVGGCLAQRDGEVLQKRLPHVDIVFGTNNHLRLPQLIKAARKEQKICD